MKIVYQICLIGILLVLFSCKGNGHSYTLENSDYNNDTLALVYFHQGQIYTEQNNDSAALLCYMKAKDELKTNPDTNLLMEIHNCIGFIHLMQDLPEEALIEFKEAYSYANRTPELFCFRTMILRNLARAYLVRSILMPNDKTENMDSASITFEKALENITEETSPKVILSVHRELASIYVNKKDFRKALKYLSYQADTCATYADYSVKADIYREMGLPDSACLFLKKCLSASEIYFKRSVFLRLFELEKERKNMEQAVVYADSFLILHDSITKFIIPEKIAEVQQKYESEKLRSEKAELELKNERSKYSLLIAILFFITLFVVSYLLIQRLRSKQRILQIEMLQKENELLLNRETIDSLKKQINENQLRIRDLQESDTNKTKVNDITLKLNEYKEINRTLGKCLFQKMPIANLLPIFQTRRKVVFELSEKEKEELIATTDLAFSDFSSRLIAHFGRLSQTYLCICCLLKLQVSSRNIQRLCNLEEDNYYKSRQRLAVKFGLENTKALDCFLEEF